MQASRVHFQAAQLLEQGSDPKQGIYNVILLKEGPGNPKDRHFYTPEAIRGGAHIFEGLQCFADHPSTVEEETLPERSVRDVVGWYERVQPMEGQDGRVAMVGKLVTIPGKPYDWVRNLLDAALYKKQRDPQAKELVGLSINATGITAPIDVNDEEWNQVTQFVEAKSCDLVTQAGAGGRVASLAESMRGIIKCVREGAMDVVNLQRISTTVKGLRDERLAPIAAELDKVIADLTHAPDGSMGGRGKNAGEEEGSSGGGNTMQAKAPEKIDDKDLSSYSMAGDKLRARLAAAEKEVETLRAALGVKTAPDTAGVGSSDVEALPAKTVGQVRNPAGSSVEDQLAGPENRTDEPAGLRKNRLQHDRTGQGQLKSEDRYDAGRSGDATGVDNGRASDGADAQAVEDQLGAGAGQDEPAGLRKNVINDDKTAQGALKSEDRYGADNGGGQQFSSFDDWAKSKGVHIGPEDSEEMYAAEDGNGDGNGDPAGILADIQADLQNLADSVDDDDVKAKVDDVLSTLADIQQAIADKAAAAGAGENVDGGDAMPQEMAMSEELPGLPGAKIAKAKQAESARDKGRALAAQMPSALREATARVMFSDKLREVTRDGKPATDREKVLVAENAKLSAQIATLREAAELRKLLEAHRVPRSTWGYWSKILPGMPREEAEEMIEGFKAQVAAEAGLDVTQRPSGFGRTVPAGDGRGELTGKLKDDDIPMKEEA